MYRIYFIFISYVFCNISRNNVQNNVKTSLYDQVTARELRSEPYLCIFRFFPFWGRPALGTYMKKTRCIFWRIWRNAKISLPILHHFLYSVGACIIEGPVAEQHLIGDNTHTPGVCPLIVTASKYLRSHILNSPDYVCQHVPIAGQRDGNVKVQQLHSTLQTTPMHPP